MSGYKEQFFTGVAVEQYEQRDATLEGLNDTVKADVDELAREVTPDDSVDRRNIAGTIDDLLPTPHTDLEPLPAFVAHNYSALLEKLKEIQGRIESVDPDYRVVFETLCERTQEAYDSFQDTNCPDAEALFVSLINKIEEEVDRFMSFHIPPLEQVHQQAVTLAGQCDAFEVKRDSEDWSGALLNEEADIYALVDDVLAQLDALFEESAEVLSNWETADVDSIHDAYAAELEALKRQVREAAAEMAGRKATLDSQVANEEAKFNKAQRDMQNELRSCEVEAQNKQAQVESLVNQIKQLSDKLKQAQLDLWRAQKQAIILNTGLLMLNDRHNANTSSNGSELDSVNHALNDSRVAIDNANVAEAMSRQVAQQVHRIRTEQEDALRANEFNLLIDKIELTTRKYYKTALALYANEARIKMKKHEREGVLVKKQRMNSGQDIAGVQECNEEIAVIDRVIAEEEENKAQLEDDLRTLGTSWGEYFDEAKSLQSTPAMKKKCMVVGSGWQTAIHKLKERQNMAAGEEILALLGSISILRDSPTRTGSPSRS